MELEIGFGYARVHSLRCARKSVRARARQTAGDIVSGSVYFFTWAGTCCEVWDYWCPWWRQVGGRKRGEAARMRGVGGGGKVAPFCWNLGTLTCLAGAKLLHARIFSCVRMRSGVLHPANQAKRGIGIWLLKFFPPKNRTHIRNLFYMMCPGTFWTYSLMQEIGLSKCQCLIYLEAMHQLKFDGCQQRQKQPTVVLQRLPAHRSKHRQPKEEECPWQGNSWENLAQPLLKNQPTQCSSSNWHKARNWHIKGKKGNWEKTLPRQKQQTHTRPCKTWSVKWEKASQRRQAAQLSLKREPLRLCNTRRRKEDQKREGYFQRTCSSFCLVGRPFHPSPTLTEEPALPP